MGDWPEFPNVVGAIDSTPHQIYRPYQKLKAPFYSGHRHYHCINTQLVIDNDRNIRFVQAGFLGITHDATSYRLMEPIGPDARFSKGPETFRARKAIFCSSVSKDEEVYTPETSCMKRNSFHIKNL